MYFFWKSAQIQEKTVFIKGAFENLNDLNIFTTWHHWLCDLETCSNCSFVKYCNWVDIFDISEPASHKKRTLFYFYFSLPGKYCLSIWSSCCLMGIWSPGGAGGHVPPSSTEGAATQCVKGASEDWPEEELVSNVLPDLDDKAVSWCLWSLSEMILRFNLRSDAESAATLPFQILHFLFRSQQTSWGFDTRFRGQTEAKTRSCWKVFKRKENGLFSYFQCTEMIYVVAVTFRFLFRTRRSLTLTGHADPGLNK